MKEFVLNLLPKSLRNPAIAAVGFLRNPKYAWLYSHRFGNLSTSQLRYLIEKQFLAATGHPLNLDNPTTFNEKLQWLKLYYHDPLMTKCADKVLVRDYVRDTIGEQYLIPILGTFNNIDEIDINKLPNRFVLKVNWGSGQNIICKDRSTFDWESAKQKLREWMSPIGNHYYNFFEWCYKDIQPRILAEQYIEQIDGYLVDYKFHVFNGEPRLLQLIDRWETHKETIYDISNWRKTDLHFTYPLLDRKFEKDKFIEQMIGLCRELAKPFPYVRVDLYKTNSHISFGELTFYPGNGELAMSPFWGEKLGALISLTPKSAQ